MGDPDHLDLGVLIRGIAGRGYGAENAQKGLSPLAAWASPPKGYDLIRI